MAKIETRTLFCRMTDQELLEAGLTAASKAQQLKRLLAEAKSTAAKFKLDTDELKGQISRIQNDIANKETLREIDCKWFVNTKQRIKILRRLDTMEVVSTFKMEDHHFQEDLFGDKEKFEEDTEQPLENIQNEDEQETEVTESESEAIATTVPIATPTNKDKKAKKSKKKKEEEVIIDDSEDF